MRCNFIEQRKINNIINVESLLYMRYVCLLLHILNVYRRLYDVKAKRLSRSVYEYKGYRISNCGYHHPDHCIWWEAVNIVTGCTDYHATTKKHLIEIIDDVESNGEGDI